MKKAFALILAAAMAFALLAGCAAEPQQEASGDVAMQYMTPAELASVLGTEGYTVMDVRKAADFETAAIPGSVSVDMDAAKNGDTEAGAAAMTAATEGLDDILVLVCYSGKAYAQAATNALSAAGYDMSKVYTLEGGMKAWNEAYPDGISDETAGDDCCGGEEPVTAPAVDQRRVYVTPQWVKSVIDGMQPESANYVILEVSYGATADDSPTYNSGHIPGAIHASIMEVEDATGDEIGAYNLLAAEEIRDYALSHGITKDTVVIMYGNDISGTARQAYAYIYTGVENVKILNGSLDAWTAAGYALETERNEGVAAGDFGTEVPAHPEYWVSIDEAKDRVENDETFKLVSIRSEAEWLGETSGYGYMDKAGEPRGAVWGKGALSASDVADFTNDDGTVKELAELAEIWADCDFTLDDHLSFYCGTGWRATVPFLVMYQEGYDNISVYDGGWYQWLMDDSLPVQVGDPASDSVQYMTVGELPTGKAAK